MLKQKRTISEKEAREKGETREGVTCRAMEEGKIRTKCYTQEGTEKKEKKEKRKREENRE